MTEFANTPLSPWANYYAILGSAAAALIGIQFVVIAFVAARSRLVSAETISAFATPTVVHLGAALVISALMSDMRARAGSLSHTCR